MPWSCLGAPDAARPQHAHSSWDEAWGSLLQLLLNVVLLVMVGAAGLGTQRAIWRRRWLLITCSG